MGRRFITLVIATLGLLPIATWLPGGLTTAGYGIEWSGWLSGGAIVVGLAVVLAMAARRYPPLWTPGLCRVPIRILDPASRPGIIVVPVIALIAYLTIAN